MQQGLKRHVRLKHSGEVKPAPKRVSPSSLISEVDYNFHCRSQLSDLCRLEFLVINSLKKEPQALNAKMLRIL